MEEKEINVRHSRNDTKTGMNTNKIEPYKRIW
jgi:hypothetical protein